MPNNSSFPIGTVLVRKDKLGNEYDELRIVGSGDQLVATSNTQFSPNIQLDAAVVRREYTYEYPENVDLSQPTYVDPGPTAEEVFAGAKGDGLSRLERAALVKKQKSEDPRTGDESVVVDTGVPTTTLVGTSEPETPLERSARAGRKGATASRKTKEENAGE